VTTGKVDDSVFVLSAEVEPGDPTKIASELDRIEEQLKDGRAAAKVKLAAIGVLSTLAEDEARVLLDLATRDNVTEVQVGAIQAISTSHRRASRPALRAALTASAPFVRAAAFAALLELEREQPLAAIRVGLAVSAEDIRIRAVSALITGRPAIEPSTLSKDTGFSSPSVANTV